MSRNAQTRVYPFVFISAMEKKTWFFMRIIYALDMHCLICLAAHRYVKVLVTQKWQSFQATSGVKAQPRIYKHSIHCDLFSRGMQTTFKTSGGSFTALQTQLSLVRRGEEVSSTS